jgi:hypothetical protein
MGIWIASLAVNVFGNDNPTASNTCFTKVSFAFGVTPYYNPLKQVIEGVKYDQKQKGKKTKRTSSEAENA